MLRNSDRPAYAGEKDRVVKIEQRPVADDDDTSGAPIDGPWTTLSAREWMQKLDMQGSERFSAAQLSAPFDTIWKMGYRADMDPDLIDVAKLRRLLHGGRIYDITSGRVFGRKEAIELETLARHG